jgi:hypothetical protein
MSDGRGFCRLEMRTKSDAVTMHGVAHSSEVTLQNSLVEHETGCGKILETHCYLTVAFSYAGLT